MGESKENSSVSDNPQPHVIKEHILNNEQLPSGTVVSDVWIEWSDGFFEKIIRYHDGGSLKKPMDTNWKNHQRRGWENTFPG